MSATVRTQQELDAALAAGELTIYIQSGPECRLTVTYTGSSRVEALEFSYVEAWGSSRVVAWGSSTVVARDSSHVEAWGSSRVVAWGSSRVEAWASSRVEARGSSHVVARGSSRVVASQSSHVEAREFSHVEARDSSHVEAQGFSLVEARNSSHVEARDSSHVVALGSSHVEAWGVSHVEAWASSHVEASPFVAVHLHSPLATVSGGVVINMTAVSETDPRTWCDLHGAEVDAEGNVTLYKALHDDLISGRSWMQSVQWKTKGVVECDDFVRTNECGGGLHLGPTPSHATAYLPSATRWLKVQAKLTDLQPVTDGTAKVKVPRCVVLGEVDRFGMPIEVSLTQDDNGRNEG